MLIKELLTLCGAKTTVSENKIDDLEQRVYDFILDRALDVDQDGNPDEPKITFFTDENDNDAMYSVTFNVSESEAEIRRKEDGRDKLLVAIRLDGNESDFENITDALMKYIF